MATSPQPALILASASPRRVALLRQIGLEPEEILPAELDETPLKGELPRACAIRLADAKARVIADQLDRPALVLAADTIVAVGRRILQKAENPQQARAYLALLSGRRHTVYTAISIRPSKALAEGRCASRVVASKVAFSCLTPHHIEALITAGDWQGKAGGYALQGMAARFIRFISGSPSAVIGLPLFETSQLLQGQPHPWFQPGATESATSHRT
ncbi:Maf family protein [Sorlinia euscelidii]|uniref:dTTP/UTP pyrophosphatase n=1 Tax=Sorlinia euscelidii TaxID=3081148 RepID=A0ABU7U280_9PROT